MAIEKIKILRAVLELPAKQHCQFSPLGPLYEVNGLDWQCYLAGSSKTAPRILIFSIFLSAKPSIQLKSIAIWSPAFFMHNNSFIATVIYLQFTSYYVSSSLDSECHHMIQSFMAHSGEEMCQMSINFERIFFLLLKNISLIWVLCIFLKYVDSHIIKN